MRAVAPLTTMELRTLAEYLGHEPIFEHLEDPFLQLLTECAQEREIPPETFLCRAGEPATSFFLVREGSVALEVYTPHRHAITIQTLGPGELVGWAWLIPPYRWNFDAHCMDPARVIAFDSQCLRQLFEQNHELGYQMLKRFLPVMAQHLRAMQMQLLEIYESEPDI